MNYLRNCIGLLLVVAVPAGAQVSVSDNDLRTGLLEANQRLQTAETRLAAVAETMQRLQRDNELLQRLLDDITQLADAATIKAAGREEALEAMFVKINLAIDKLATSYQAEVAELTVIGTGSDRDAYERALTLYSQFNDIATATELLTSIVALGELSTYTPAAKFWLAQIEFEQGNFAPAKTLLTALLAEHPAAIHEAQTLALLVEVSVLTADPQAEYFQQELLARYPESFAAAKVRQTYGIAESS